jgi:hypothetical protein
MDYAASELSAIAVGKARKASRLPTSAPPVRSNFDGEAAPIMWPQLTIIRLPALVIGRQQLQAALQLEEPAIRRCSSKCREHIFTQAISAGLNAFPSVPLKSQMPAGDGTLGF